MSKHDFFNPHQNRPNAAFSESDAKLYATEIDLKEVDNLVKFSADFKMREAKRKRKSKMRKLMVAGGLGVMGTMTIAASLGLIAGEFEPFVAMTSIFLFVFGILTLKAMQRDPLRELREKTDATQSKLLKAFNKRQEALRNFRNKNYPDSNNRLILGLAGRIASQIGVDPLWVRLAFVAAAFFSGGTLIPFYFIAGIVANASDNKTKKLSGRV